MYKYKLGVIGGGNMAKAITSGVLKGGVLTHGDIAVSDPYGGIDGLINLKDNRRLSVESEYVLIAVKPQIFKEIKGELEGAAARAVISIMAGIKSDTIADALPSGVTVIRVMPNTPCMVGTGAIAIAESDDKEAVAFAERILSTTGRVMITKEENFDAVTALSGSGPAYAYMFLDAMAASGVKLGLNPDDARIMAGMTLKGAADMALGVDKPMEELISAVCSKGGTTIEAVNKFRERKLYEIVDEAMTACFNRSVELGK